jgi:hypothetical protein
VTGRLLTTSIIERSLGHQVLVFALLAASLVEIAAFVAVERIQAGPQ